MGFLSNFLDRNKKPDSVVGKGVVEIPSLKDTLEKMLSPSPGGLLCCPMCGLSVVVKQIVQGWIYSCNPRGCDYSSKRTFDSKEECVSHHNGQPRVFIKGMLEVVLQRNYSTLMFMLSTGNSSEDSDRAIQNDDRNLLQKLGWVEKSSEDTEAGDTSDP